jgi:serine/threonine protein kinase
MAPEILAGTAATPQSDIYALGVLLYHLVTRRFPVRGRTLRELAQAHREGKMVLLRDARPNLPEDFVKVVERATAPRPGDRFASAGEMEQSLLRCMGADEAGLAAGTPRRRPAWIRGGAIAAGAVVVALAVGLPLLLSRDGSTTEGLAETGESAATSTSPVAPEAGSPPAGDLDQVPPAESPALSEYTKAPSLPQEAEPVTRTPDPPTAGADTGETGDAVPSDQDQVPQPSATEISDAGPAGADTEPDAGSVAPAATPVLQGAAPITYTAAATFFKKRGEDGERRRLDARSAVRRGDEVFLELEVSAPVYAYVLCESEEGTTSLLFPHHLLERINPLPPGMTHRLPGRRTGGRNLNWPMIDREGRDYLVLLASPDPIAALEEELAATRELETGPQEGPVVWPPISDECRQRLLDLPADRRGRPEASTPSPESLADLGADVMRGPEVARGRWIRRIAMDFPPRPPEH